MQPFSTCLIFRSPMKERRIYNKQKSHCKAWMTTTSNKLIYNESVHATEKKFHFSPSCSYSKTRLMYLSNSSMNVKWKPSKVPQDSAAKLQCALLTIRGPKKTRRLLRTEGWYPRVHCQLNDSSTCAARISLRTGFSNCSKSWLFPGLLVSFG